MDATQVRGAGPRATILGSILDDFEIILRPFGTLSILFDPGNRLFAFDDIKGSEECDAEEY